jgi:hypothetical protein
MAFDDELSTRVRDVLAVVPDVSERRSGASVQALPPKT